MGTRRKRLYLKARYLYLDSPVEIASKGPTELRPKLGGALRGRFAPAGGGKELALENEKVAFRGFKERARVALSPDGRFEINGLKPTEKGRIELESDRFEPVRREDVSIRAGKVTEVEIELVPRSGKALAGRVVREDGSGVRSARVEVFFASASTSGGQTYTDREGYFRFDWLLATPCRVEASRLVQEDGERLRLSAALEDVLPGGEAVTLVLTEGPTLSGHVLDDLGDPVRKVRIVARPFREDGGVDPRLSSSVVHQALDGVFTLRGLANGTWSLTVDAPGHDELEASVLLPRQVEGPLAFYLPREAALSGRVLRPDGEPVNGARVLLEGELRSMERAPCVTDADGRFFVRGCRPGEVRVHAEAAGCAPGWRGVRLAPGETAETTLELGYGGRIEGRLDLAGEGWEVSLRVRSEEEGRWRDHSFRTQTDFDGAFTFESLPAGEATIVAVAGARALYERFGPGSTTARPWYRSATAVVRDRETTRVSIGVEERTLPRTTVRCLTNGSPSGGKLYLGFPSVFALHDYEESSGGSYEVALPPGEYSVGQFYWRGKLGSALHVEVNDTEVQIEMWTGKLSGTVSADGTDALPLASIHLASETSFLTAKSGLDGRFFLGFLPSGKYECSVQWEGRVFAFPGKITIQPGEHHQGLALRLDYAAVSR